MKLAIRTAVAAFAIVGAGSAIAGEVKNPIFGAAPAKVLSLGQNKGVVGKGAYADYYGYYGNVYASYAQTYGNYAYSGYDPVNNYYYAYYYANVASSNYYNAYINTYYGT